MVALASVDETLNGSVPEMLDRHIPVALLADEETGGALLDGGPTPDEGVFGLPAAGEQQDGGEDGECGLQGLLIRGTQATASMPWRRSVAAVKAATRQFAPPSVVARMEVQADQPSVGVAKAKSLPRPPTAIFVSPWKVRVQGVQRRPVSLLNHAPSPETTRWAGRWRPPVEIAHLVAGAGQFAPGRAAVARQPDGRRRKRVAREVRADEESVSCVAEVEVVELLTAVRGGTRGQLSPPAQPAVSGRQNLPDADHPAVPGIDEDEPVEGLGVLGLGLSGPC